MMDATHELEEAKRKMAAREKNPRGRENAVVEPGPLARRKDNRIQMIKKIFKKGAITGWMILLMAAWFIYMSIDPLMNDTEQFLRITGMVLGGGVGSTLLIMLLLNRTLPKDEK